MMSEESNKILEDLKERIGVEYNNLFYRSCPL